MTVLISEITKTYYKPSRLAALSAVSCEFPRGTTSLLLGPNGAGKSTLLRVIAGLTNIDNGEVTGRPDGIGYFTPHLHLYGNLSVEEMLGLHGVHERLLTGNLDAKAVIRNLSKGQQVRVALAVALAEGRNLLLFDEPTTHLDADGRDELLSALASSPATKIIATHEPEVFISRFSDVRILQLRQGAVVQ